MTTFRCDGTDKPGASFGVIKLLISVSVCFNLVAKTMPKKSSDYQGLATCIGNRMR
jgi:hypothetical protein